MFKQILKAYAFCITIPFFKAFPHFFLIDLFAPQIHKWLTSGSQHTSKYIQTFKSLSAALLSNKKSQLFLQSKSLNRQSFTGKKCDFHDFELCNKDMKEEMILHEQDMSTKGYSNVFLLFNLGNFATKRCVYLIWTWI